MSSKSCRLVLLNLTLIFVLGNAAGAQVLYGNIVGTVMDPSGAVVSGAKVTATQTGTNTRTSTSTDVYGLYRLSNMPAGSYTLEFMKSGFATLVTMNVVVEFNATRRVDAALKIGTVEQPVTVMATGALLQTESSNVHSDLTSTQLLDLPQPTRSFQGLIGIMPGAGALTAGGGGTNNPTKSFTHIELNGTSDEATDVRIEGVSSVDPWVAWDSTAKPSIEAIESVNVVSASPDAEQTLASGATINVQLKSGTNDFHGSAYWFHTDNALTAKPYFAGPHYKNSRNLDNNAGGTLGGPIIKNKLFFFVSYEGGFQRSLQPQIGTVPLSSVLAGNFQPLLSASGNSNPADGTLCNPATGTAAPCIFDPKTGTAAGTGRTPFFATSTQGSNYNPACTSAIAISGTCYNMIPTARFDPITAKLDAMVPAPNYGGAGAISNNYFGNVPTRYNLQLIDAKIDWYATNKLRLSFRSGIDPHKETQIPLFGPTLGSFWNAGVATPDQHGTVYSFTSSFTYTAAPTFVIDGGFGFTHSNQVLIPTGGNQKYTSDVLGIPGTNLGRLPYAGGLADFPIGCSIYYDAEFCGSLYTSYGESYNYLQYLDPVFSYFVNFTKLTGKHTLKFGANLLNTHMNHFETGPDVIAFDGGVTTDADPNQPYNINFGYATPYNSYADFIIGAPTSWYTHEMPNTMTHLRVWNNALYFGDVWQLTHRLTLSYGTGWEYYPVPTHGDHGLEIFLPGPAGTGTYEVCGYGSVPKDCGIRVSKKGFTPRLGVAFRALNDLVIRAGYGITREQYDMARDTIYNEPEVLSYSNSTAFSNPYFPVGSLEVGIPLPAVPDYKSGVISPLPPGFSLDSATDPINFKRGYVQSYNFTVQKTFGSWSAQAAYVGTHSIHMYTRYNFNYCAVAATGQCNQYYPVFGGQSEGMILPLNSSHYNALQTSLDHRFNNGFFLAANYTYSKWVGLCCSANADSGPKISDPQYFYLNKAIMPGNRTNVFNLSAVFQSPFGRKKKYMTSGPGAAILADWQLNTVFVAYSGEPFSINDGNIASGSAQLATYAKGGHVSYPKKVQEWFDPADFQAQPTCPTGVTKCFGNVPFDSLVGPGGFNVDLSLFRDVRLTERVKAQFRFEVYNLTNTPHFANPNSDISSSSFGQISSVNAPNRLIDQRYFRIGVRFSF
jgi:Carboxypeptidase regulatory-like domain